jgi:hypothetical protein
LFRLAEAASLQYPDPLDGGQKRPSRYLGLAALDGLSHLEAFELGMPEIEGLVVASAAMRGAERLGVGPRFEGRAAVPDGVRCA